MKGRSTYGVASAVMTTLLADHRISPLSGRRVG
jgi:hypothetical protein